MDLPIIRIIKSDKGYRLGEVLEVDDDLAKQLINEGIAKKATKKQLEKWEKYLLGQKIKKRVDSDKCERYKYTKIKIDNYIDNVEQFSNYRSFFYDEVGIFWFWDNDNKKYIQKDEVDVMNMFDDILGFEGQTVSSRLKSNYMEAFKRVGRKNKPKDAPIKWIQFKDKAYSISSDMIYNVTPDYFFTNPIPYKLGESDETPFMDKLFKDWVGEENIQLLYEIIAYCCYRAYPMQLLFSLVGNGRNGKTCFLRLLSRFIGQENVCSTELDLLVGRQGSRFESFKLYKKLVCVMGETNFGTLNKSSMLKKLTGGDLIGFEMKGKKPFDDYNYAKMIIASNSLPTSDDTSEGFYRRWIIIDFPNQFPEGKDILLDIPEHEYNNLALKVTKILPGLIDKGIFSNQSDIEERKKKYIMSSNPLTFFLDLCCERDEDTFVSYGEVYTAYIKYLNVNKKRRVSMKEFKIALEDEGYWIERTSKKIDDDAWKNDRWINGIGLKYDWKEKVRDICDDLHKNVTRKPIVRELSTNKVTNVTNVTKYEVPQEMKVEDELVKG